MLLKTFFCWQIFLINWNLKVAAQEVGDWTWLSGADAINDGASYGVQGQWSATNKPSFRNSHAMVADPTGKLLYVFAGAQVAPGTTSDWVASVSFMILTDSSFK